MLLENYGTFFQHFCLRQALSELGFSCARYLAGRSPFKGFRILAYFLRRFIGHPTCVVDNVIEFQNYIKFRREFEKLIGPLHEDCDFGPRAVCVVGSDQILSPNPKDWFSDAPDDCKRIIYAGSTDWLRQSKSQQWQTNASVELPRFSAVSVREEAGVPLCQKYTRKDVRVARVADPVFLLTLAQYLDIADQKHIFSKPTLFCYFVNGRKDNKIDVKALEMVAAKLKCELKIVGIQGSAKFIPSCCRTSLSPTQFLAAYRDASYIVTNSFHGTAFALIFNKPFITIEQGNIPGFDFNNRQDELLMRVGFNKYAKTWNEAREFVDVLSGRYDYGLVSQKLDEERKKSLAWLRGALQ